MFPCGLLRWLCGFGAFLCVMHLTVGYSSSGNGKLVDGDEIQKEFKEQRKKFLSKVVEDKDYYELLKQIAPYEDISHLFRLLNTDNEINYLERNYLSVMVIKKEWNFKPRNETISGNQLLVDGVLKVNVQFIE